MRRNKRNKFLTYKIFTMTNLSKAAQKYADTILTLTKKSETTPLTVNELVRLINARLQIENKTLSGVYKALFITPSKDIEDLVILMCGGVIPTFETFKTEMLAKDADRFLFSNYAGLLAAARLSKSAQLASKVARQGGEVTKAPKVANVADVPTTKAPKVAKAAKAPKVAAA